MFIQSRPCSLPDSRPGPCSLSAGGNIDSMQLGGQLPARLDSTDLSILATRRSNGSESFSNSTWDTEQRLDAMALGKPQLS